jgi:ABC-type microcin C transport system permease subunit YejE
LSQSYPTQRIEGKDTVVIMTKKQAENINIVFKNTKTQIDKLKIEIDSITKIKPTVVKDTIYKRGSILIPNGNYLLYNFNEAENRYELDPNSVIAAKGTDDDTTTNLDAVITTIGFVTIFSLFILLL